jgi:hypothetical protein
LWNVIPRWNGTRDITSVELHEGIARLAELIGLLANLRAVVLVGSQAARAEPHLRTLQSGLEVFTSSHPSPIVRHFDPERWARIPSEWAAVHSCSFALWGR